MENKKTIAILGGTGQVGMHVVRMSLEKGYQLRLLVRNQTKIEEKLGNVDASAIIVIEGNTTSLDDVKKTIEGAEVVISCLGNTQKNITIMEQSFHNIFLAASEHSPPPRCLMITSFGMGGSSKLINMMLTLFVGKKGIADYEKADSLARQEERVPCMLVRPYALNSKESTGGYRVAKETTSLLSLKAIPRIDVAKFLVDCIEDVQWDNKKGVTLTV